MYTCKKCKANVDAGELVGGVCDDCREEEKNRKTILSRHYELMYLVSL